MKSVLLLAWRYVAFNRLKTAILVACVSITLFLPLSVSLLIERYNRDLRARAQATPLVVGARGNRFDLALKTLYFRQGRLDPVPAGEVARIRKTGLAGAIPIHARFTAGGFPVIGTSLEYFDFRGLRVREGRLPGMLGETVVGSNVARELGLSPGTAVLSDQQSLYNIARTGPLKMHVVGVLARSGSPDDSAVFVDVRTAWIIEGLGHGHMDLVESSDPRYILRQTDKNVAATAALGEYTEVTPENVATFHFHGDMREFPLTSVIVLPKDTKSATLLKARYNASRTCQMLKPLEVVEELMGIVFKVKRFFDANFAVIALSTVLFLVLIVLLSLRIRRNERATMHKLGASRLIVFYLQASELLIVLLMSLALTALLSALLILLSPNILRIV